MNPVLCVLRNLLTKLVYFTKRLAEFVRFVGAVLIEFPCDTLVLCMNPA